MPLTDAQVKNLANTNLPKKQDPKVPMVINMDDGRLMPNTPRLRMHANYRPYHGSLKATQDERMAYIASLTGAVAPARAKRKVQDDEGPFDLDRASKPEMVRFAATEYGLVLEPGMPAGVMRERIKEAAKEAAGGNEDEGTDLS